LITAQKLQKETIFYIIPFQIKNQKKDGTPRLNTPIMPIEALSDTS